MLHMIRACHMGNLSSWIENLTISFLLKTTKDKEVVVIPNNKEAIYNLLSLSLSLCYENSLHSLYNVLIDLCAGFQLFWKTILLAF